MATAPNQFSLPSSDADLRQLIEQLSSGPSFDELHSAGLDQTYGKSAPTGASSGSPSLVGQFYHRDFGGSGGGVSTRDDLYNRISLASPSAAIYHGLKKSAHRKAEAKRRNAFNAAQGEATQEYLGGRSQEMQMAKDELNKRDTANKVNSYFSSDTMTGLYDTLRSNVLQNALSDIVNKYQSQLRTSAFQTAGQGLMGSSVDAERRGSIDQSQNAEATKAAGDADSYVTGVKNQNETQRQNLIDSLSSDNPADAASITQSERQLQSDMQKTNQQYASSAANSQINQNGLNLQSQSLGNLMSNYANLYNTGQHAQAYGGGSAF